MIEVRQNKLVGEGTRKMVLILFLWVLAIPVMTAQEESHYRVRKVVIDAGHGGKDPGTLGKYSKEKDIALAIALKVGKYIEEKIPDVQVIYTRKTDKFIELHRRGEIANKAHADLFISIHCNSNPKHNIMGAETYVMGIDKDNRNMEVVKKENDVITLEDNYKKHYEGFDPNDPVSMISFNMTQNVYRSQSLEFATLVQDQFRTRAGRPDRGVRQAMFLVLWKTYMPSVLIETGFLSNLREEAFLRSENGQAIIASAIFRAFREYKSRIESRSNFSFDEEAFVKPWLGVQVMASAKKLPADYRKFRKYEKVTELHEGNIYRYIVGRVSSLQEAQNLKKNLEKSFPGAFVVAVKKEKIIPLQEALNELQH